MTIQRYFSSHDGVPKTWKCEDGLLVLYTDHLAALAEKDREHENQLLQLEKIANEVLDGYKDKVVILKAEKEAAVKKKDEEIFGLEAANVIQHRDLDDRDEQIAALTAENERLRRLATLLPPTIL